MDYCIEDVKEHFAGLDSILFVPYARPSGISHDAYTSIVRERLEKINLKVKGIHEFSDPLKALDEFQGIYIGGGNTFLLIKSLHEHQLIDAIKEKVEDGRLKYMGSSAGTNVACMTVNNTNDMPIVHPPSFDGLSLVPFNINPHYLDPDPNSKHKGETRETRINEFHFQSAIPVVGLREGSWLKLKDNHLSLGGTLSARLFRAGEKAIEMNPDEDFNFLLKPA